MSSISLADTSRRNGLENRDIFEVPGVKTIALRILEESELFHYTTGRFL